MKKLLCAMLLLLVAIGRAHAGGQFLSAGYGNDTLHGGNDVTAIEGYQAMTQFTSQKNASLTGFGGGFTHMGVLLVTTLKSATECANVTYTDCSGGGLSNVSAVNTTTTTGVCQAISYKITDTSTGDKDQCYKSNWTNNTTGEFYTALLTNVAISSPVDGSAVTSSGTSTATWAAGSYTTTSADTLVITVTGVDTAQATSANFTTGGDTLFGLIQKKVFASYGGAYMAVSARNVKAGGVTVAAHSIIGNTSASHYITTTFGVKPLYPPPFINPILPTNAQCTSGSVPWSCCSGAGTGTCPDNANCGSGTTISYSGIDNSFSLSFGSVNATACPVQFNLGGVSGAGFDTTPEVQCGERQYGFTPAQSIIGTTGVTIALPTKQANANCVSSGFPFTCCTGSGTGSGCPGGQTSFYAANVDCNILPRGSH